MHITDTDKSDLPGRIDHPLRLIDGELFANEERRPAQMVSSLGTTKVSGRVAGQVVL